MGRTPCCEKVGLKKGPWTPEEDQKLLAYIQEHGHGSWRALPAKAGLQRCGKSCRLRWTNYLRPDIKRGNFSAQEEQTIVQLHALLGNRWSAIATHLPKRTDNEIKNYWNTHLKKRLAKMGIDPVTHKPKSDALGSIDGQSGNSANVSHMAQWESARLEAEARLARESKLRSASFQHQLGFSGSSSASAQFLHSMAEPLAAPPLCLDIIKAWQGVWSKSGAVSGNCRDFESPKSTLSFLENPMPILPTNATDSVANSGTSEGETIKEEEEEGDGGQEDWKSFEKLTTHLPQFKERLMENSMLYTSSLIDMVFSEEPTGDGEVPVASNFIEGFTDLLLENSDDRNSSEGGGNCNINEGGNAGDKYDENKNYWDNILDMVNSSPSDSSPVF